MMKQRNKPYPQQYIIKIKSILRHHEQIEKSNINNMQLSDWDVLPIKRFVYETLSKWYQKLYQSDINDSEWRLGRLWWNDKGWYMASEKVKDVKFHKWSNHP